MIEGSAGDGIGDSNIWWTLYLDEKLDDHEGDSNAPSGAGARRIDIVGGVWLEVRIMMEICWPLPYGQASRTMGSSPVLYAFAASMSISTSEYELRLHPLAITVEYPHD